MRDHRVGYDALQPVTIISLGRAIVQFGEVSKLIKKFIEEDDVWSPSFLSTVIVKILPGSRSYRRVCQSGREDLACNIESEILFDTASVNEASLPSGPYFVYCDRVYEAWRLYQDRLDCFEISLAPQLPDHLGRYEYHNDCLRIFIAEFSFSDFAYFQLQTRTEYGRWLQSRAACISHRHITNHSQEHGSASRTILSSLVSRRQ